MAFCVQQDHYFYFWTLGRARLALFPVSSLYAKLKWPSAGCISIWWATCICWGWHIDTIDCMNCTYFFYHAVEQSSCVSQLLGSDWWVFIPETVRTAQVRPCVSDSKTPYRGKCLRSLYRHLLELRSLHGKRKYNISSELNAFSNWYVKQSKAYI